MIPEGCRRSIFNKLSLDYVKAKPIIPLLAKAAYNLVHSVRATKYFQLILGAGDGGVEDAMGYSLRVAIWNNDLYRIVFQALRFVY